MASKTAPTWAAVLKWAAGSTRPIGDCQGFAGNDFVSKFGSFKQGYYSANTAMAASQKLGHFHKGTPPHDGKIYWVFFKFPVYGHVMLFCNGVILGDTSHATHFLNRKRTIGVMKLEDYPKAYPYLGYSTTNGVNTIPGAVQIQHNLSPAEVRKVATFLNSKKLGRTTTASKDGINVDPGKTSSNYYWLLQKYFKGNPTGVPAASTYLRERKLLHLLSTPVVTPPVVSPVITKPSDGSVTYTAVEYENLKTAHALLESLIKK